LLQTREKINFETKKQTIFLANQAKIQSNSNEQKSTQTKVRLYELVPGLQLQINQSQNKHLKNVFTDISSAIKLGIFYQLISIIIMIISMVM
jgi:hypothetical protein